MFEYNLSEREKYRAIGSEDFMSQTYILKVRAPRPFGISMKLLDFTNGTFLSSSECQGIPIIHLPINGDVIQAIIEELQKELIVIRAREEHK